MKNFFVLLILIATQGYSQTGQQNNTTTETIDLETECEKSVSFGDIDICLPM